MTVSAAPAATPRTRRKNTTPQGLGIPRRYTHAGVDPFDNIRWERRRTVITNPDGSVVFQMDDVEVPASWSQLATDIVVSKYFRKAGLPGAPGHETSVRQVVHRIAHTIRAYGEEVGGYFASADDAEAFEAELKHMLVHQIGAFNSPVWFNCGLHHEYGIGGSGGNFWWDAETGQVRVTPDSYSRPQVSACFIQSVGDDLMSIFELARNEARVFKFGSGTGTNFSALRGRMEKLSGGGTSSGLMSFLEVLDKGAGATKSGGTTRRAAKMVVLDMDHPEILDFVRWKVREEKKVAALVAGGYSSDFNGDAYGTVSGQNSNNSVRVPDRFLQAVEADGVWQTTMRTTGAVYQTHKARELWREIASAAWQCADPGVQYDDTIQRWHTCKTTGRINATNPCVTGDTMVATSEGWQRIDSLVGRSATVMGADGQFHAATSIFKTGRKPVYLLRTVAGRELRLTADHRVLTQEGRDVPASELSSGDRIRLCGAGFGSRSLDEEKALELGRYLRNSCGAVLAVGDAPHLIEPGFESDWIQEYIASDGFGQPISLCPSFFDLDRRSTRSFLKGLFEVSEASWQEQFEFSAASTELLRQIQLTLLNFEVLSELREHWTETSTRVAPDGRSPMSFIETGEGPTLLVTYGYGLKRAMLGERPTRLSDLVDAVASTPQPLGEEDVFDLTEPVTHHFAANGVVVHNCSEYVHLDDTACNLASINLMKFLREDGSFDVEGYRHANRVFFLAQEILVGLASYPTEKIAENSCKFRPLGLGYANLGTLLMMQGFPYDSAPARAYAAAITAIMTGEAYAMSAEIAAGVGPFEGFEENRESMLDVMRLHRDAARAIDGASVSGDLRAAAIESWDRAVALGMLHGYRNSQATVLAPTGTIGLLMDCDTTGVEPDFALVKFKKLAGGGYFKIVNQSVPAALRRLGYDDPAIERIVRYAIGTGSLDGAPHINRSSLAHKHLTQAEIDAIESVLPSVLDVRFAFVRGILRDDTLTRLGVSQQERSKPGWNALPYLGFTDAEIEQANAVICGTQTVEGAPGLDPRHLAVFDCANRCGPRGTRYIQPMGHVRMMAAVQPFLSGAISKTVNLPSDATVEEVEQIYFEGWKLGLKAIALYRDGSKLSQPLTTRTDDGNGNPAESEARPEVRGEAVAPTPPPLRRKRLPKRRYGFTQEARIAGHKVFIRTGEYDDGQLGEIFIDMHKEGAAFRSMMNCFAISVSMGLQYGVPLEDLVDQFVFTRFEPQGRVEGHDNLKVCTSVIDYIFRVLGVEYLHRTDLAHIVDEKLEGQVTGHVPSQVSWHQHHKSANGAPGPIGDEVTRDHPPVAAAPQVVIATSATQERLREMREKEKLEAAASRPDALYVTLSGDAPMCNQCGFITVRNGTCFRCMNCGNSLGCS